MDNMNNNNDDGGGEVTSSSVLNNNNPVDNTVMAEDLASILNVIDDISAEINNELGSLILEYSSVSHSPGIPENSGNSSVNSSHSTPHSSVSEVTTPESTHGSTGDSSHVSDHDISQNSEHGDSRVQMLDAALDSFEISIDEEHTSADYIELLKISEDHLQKSLQLERSLSDKEAEITEKDRQIELKEDQIASIARKINQCSREKEEEIAALKTVQDQCIKLKDQQIASLNIEKEKLIDNKRTMEKLLQQEIDQSEKIRVAGERERKELNQMNRDLERNVIEKRFEMYEMMKVVKREREEVGEKSKKLEGEINIQEMKNRDMKNMLDFFQKENQDLKNINEQLRTRAEENVDSGLTNNRSVEQELSTFLNNINQDLVNKKDQEIANLKKKIDDLEMEQTEKAKNLNEIEGELEKRDGEIIKMEGEIEKKANNLSEIEGELEKRDAVKIKMEGEIEKRDGVISKMEDQVAKITEKNIVLNEDKEFLRGENVKMKNELKQIKGEQEVDGLHSLKEEFRLFRENIVQEIAELKQNSIGDIPNKGKSKKNSPPKKIKNNSSQTTLQSANRFSPLQFESNESQKPEISPDENGRTIDTRTSNVGTKKALLVTTSMSRDIDSVEFDQSYESGSAKFARYHGRKVEKMKNFLPSKLEEEKCDIVIFQGGGNDLSSTMKAVKPTSLTNIANHIIGAGHIVARTGAKVAISSVLPRRDFHLQLKRKELNDILRGLCALHNFVFIENSNIVLSKHILPDGVHLNEAGTSLFSQNLLNCLNDVSC